MPLIYRNIMLMNYCVHRYIYMTTVNNKTNNNNITREGKFMKKIIIRESPKKKWYPERNNISPSFPTSVKKLVSPHVTRRVKVLNKLFMKYITDIMATGEISEDVIGLGIEISQVKVSTDFKIVNVRWFSHNTNNLEQITDILDKASYKLRHELSQLKIIGVVPPIKFVRDKQSTIKAKLENIFETADYGEDYVPTQRIPPKPELILFTKLSKDVSDKIIEYENSDININEDYADDLINDKELYDINLPPMRFDVLGLNQGIIMTQIKQSLHKSRESIRNKMQNLSINTPETLNTFNPSSISTIRTEEEIQAFDDFLLKRRIEEKRQKKYESEYLNENNFNFLDKIEDTQMDHNEDFNFDRFLDSSEEGLK